jgi:hypothetical protein
MAITVDTNNPAYSSADGVLFNKSQTTLIQYPGGLAGSYAIPDSVTGIKDRAFAFCTSLTSVNIGDSVTSIGYGAFALCTSLTSVIIPDSVTGIGSSAFYSCTSLTDVVIPDSVTSIGDRAFYSCTSLTGIYFKGTPPAIRWEPFPGCEATVYYLPQNAASWPATFGGLPTALWQLSIADLNVDCNVDFFDFLTFAAAWQAVSGVDAAYKDNCDLAEPFGIIDIADLQSFANQWLISPCQ